MAKATKISVRRADSGWVTAQVPGFSIVSTNVGALPTNVRAYLAAYGCAVIYQRMSADEEDLAVIDRRVRARHEAFVAGLTETNERGWSPPCGWDVLHHAVARAKGIAVAQVRGTVLTMDQWKAVYEARQTQRAVGAILQERADAMVGDGGALDIFGPDPAAEAADVPELDAAA